MGRRILNDALRTMVNAERRGMAKAHLQPISTVMTSFLKIMKDHGYIKDFQVYDPHRVGKITVELQGRINDCRALTYRQDLKAKDIEKYTANKLPTRQLCACGDDELYSAAIAGPTPASASWGYVVITTPNGVLDHEEAAQQNVGGQVLGYFY
ncbi:40S ribosomal protein S15a-5 [Vitis vinifera]|uniref:40S ribosomal protein S15a-5 n=1 Tax=Vitis vinifera TaxID=29760 RepID=A0A438EW09_VITVI|nr:40S ribosomal protein S15a-5 [Vitis vinifera]